MQVESRTQKDAYIHRKPYLMQNSNPKRHDKISSVCICSLKVSAYDEDGIHCIYARSKESRSSIDEFKVILLASVSRQALKVYK